MTGARTWKLAGLLLAVSVFWMLFSLTLAGTISYTYDDAGRVIRVDYEGGKAITYTYDAAGNLLQRQVIGAGGTVRLAVGVQGQGTVTSDPLGISCPEACEAAYGEGTVVRLRATPGVGAGFVGWAGACQGSDTCEVALTGDQTISAHFGSGHR